MSSVSVTDNVVQKPGENITHNAEIKNECQFDSASSVYFFPTKCDIDLLNIC
jgi:hypothetical protein